MHHEDAEINTLVKWFESSKYLTQNNPEMRQKRAIALLSPDFGEEML